MSTANEPEIIEQVTRNCQIIVGALVTGVLVFLAIAASIDLGIKRPVQPGAGAGAGQQAASPDGMPEAKVNPNAGSLLDAFVSGPFITYTAIAFAVLFLSLSFVVPAIGAVQQRRAIAAGKAPMPPQQGIGREAFATETGQLALVYQQLLIVGAAMIEGPAFFAAVAYLIEKSPIALGLAAVLVLALILRFPTRRRIELWIEQQREKLVLDKQG